MDKLFEIIEINPKGELSKDIYSGQIVIFHCTKGSSRVYFGAKEYQFTSGSHFVIFETQHFKFIECSDDFRCFACKLALEFFTEIYPYLDHRMWHVFKSMTPESVQVKEAMMLTTIFEQLVTIHHIESLHYRKQLSLHIIVSYLYLTYNTLLLHSDSVSSEEPIALSSGAMIDRFILLCDKHHISERAVGFYADKMHLSVRHLYNITKEVIGQTPKQIIDSYVVGTIKKLLLSTSLSLGQIADMMNFPDQSTLRQYFVRNVGMSPSKYRSRDE